MNIAGKGKWLLAIIATAGVLVAPEFGRTLLGDSSEGASAASRDHRIPPDSLDEVLDTEARNHLAPVTDLPERASFTAKDSVGQRLRPERYSAAHSAEVVYQSSRRAFRLALAFDKATMDGDASENCEDKLASGLYLDCDVQTLQDGRVRFIKVIALVEADLGFEPEPLMALPKEEISRHNGPIWFRRSVEMRRPLDSYYVSASEMVAAQDLASALSEMTTNVEDLAALAADEDLNMADPK